VQPEAPSSLVDSRGLARFLDRVVPGVGDRVVAERIVAGHSNETFLVRAGEHQWILRRPPAGPLLPTAHDVLREHRVLVGLSRAGIRAPKPFVACDDTSVIGAPFYLMERCPGFVLRDRLPADFPPGDAARRAVGHEMVDALAELHAVDWRQVGLSDLGREAGYLERQLKRWTSQLDLTLPHTRPLPDLIAVSDWLARNRPASGPASIVHGDYKLDNVLFSAEGGVPRLTAILDWEMATIGDPLADLGWLLWFWLEPGETRPGAVADSYLTAQPGFARRGELIDRYAARTGRELHHVKFYHILAGWKLAIIVEGSYARHLRGRVGGVELEALRLGVPRLAAHLRGQID
jgi:aminoglycoside phosphotransferase (APT) family kinase protein